MRPGERIAGRFELLEHVRETGMSMVCRAVDMATGEPVAIKLVRGISARSRARFEREVKVLAGLTHPRIVRYIDHGVEPEGVAYLVMEWLEGEDLRSRLERGPLSLQDAVMLARDLAEALASAHEGGFVHRDVKPENIFLRDCAIGDARIIDFGIAHLLDEGITLTSPGVILGTPGYMAPEQVRGGTVDARADVFALGCVIYEAVCGRPPFEAEHPLALLAKLVLDAPAPMREHVPDVPQPLDDLVLQMIAKDPDDRPSDARTVVRMLLDPTTMGDQAGAAHSGSLTPSTQEILGLVVVGGGVSDRTLSPDEPSIIEHAVIEVAAAHDARVERLGEASFALLLQSAGEATDLATRTARCAMAVGDALPEVPVAFAVGRAVAGPGVPVGEVIDRAVAAFGEGGPGTHLDDVTAGLLPPRFDLTAEGGRFLLVGETEVAEPVRTLLGRPTPCVGRDVELATMRLVVERAFEERRPAAVLVIGDAGSGKSRLRHELADSLALDDLPCDLWLGRGDPTRPGSPFAVLAHALGHAVGLPDVEPELAMRVLRARVGRHVPSRAVGRVTDFLAELLGLRAERARKSGVLREPARKGDQMLRAFLDLVEAEAKARPVLLLLEDLHWGDLPSVKLVDAALRALTDVPFAVAAFARTELDTLFPGLWADRDLTTIHLRALGRKACERLVREVLSDDVDPQRLAQIVERSGGNAFYLEELIRTETAGEGGDVPPTVMAMMQARLASLDADAQRVLRAASVLGQRFTMEGLQALLGDETRIDGWVDHLVRRELLSRGAPSATAPTEEPLVFRHALVREAAYGLLTEADRRLGHRLAAQLLESSGDRDPVALAEHFERGALWERAGPWWLRAATAAIKGGDLDAVLARVERGRRCGASGEALGRLWVMEAQVHAWRGDNADAWEACEAAWPLLTEGTADWYELLWVTMAVALRRGMHAWLVGAVETVRSRPGGEDSRLAALARLSALLHAAGRTDLGASLLDEVEAQVLDDPALDPLVEVEIAQAASFRALHQGDVAGHLAAVERACRAADATGDLRRSLSHRVDRGYACMNLGLFEEAVEELRGVVLESARLGLRWLEATGLHNLGRALTYMGALDEAQQVESAAIEAFVAQGNPRLEGASRAYLAEILLARERPAEAEREAQRAAEALEVAPPLRPYALALLGRALRVLGRADEALEATTDAVSAAAFEAGESTVRLQHAECLHATGDIEGARDAIASARERLLARADRVADAALRESFLKRVPEHRRTLDLAASWLEE